MQRYKETLFQLLMILSGLVMAVVVILLCSNDPALALKFFFTGPFSSEFFFGDMINTAVPLIITGLAASVSFTASVWNLGLEGMVYFGMLTGTMAATWLKDLPAAVLTEQEQDRDDLAAVIAQRMEGKAVLFLPGWESPDYERVCRLAEELIRGFGEKPCRVVLERDMAKALGVALRLRLPENREILCLDGLWLSQDSYLDVGEPVGPAVTAVVKTLAFEK